MSPLILRLDSHGGLMGWMSWQTAVILYANDRVSWTAGKKVLRIVGGTNRFTGARSFIDVHSIVASKGSVMGRARVKAPPLTSRELFRRDMNMCMYCLAEFPDHKLTRDHVRPLSQGGEDVWTNVVTACVRCNQKKGNRTPEQAGMALHAIPFYPSYAEWLVLKNRRILADQMEFLKSQFRKDSRLLRRM